MPIENRELLELLGVFDGILEEPVRINAVGGTALTLLNAKTSTIDIDFDTNEKDHLILAEAQRKLQPGYRIDWFTNGFIFSQQLPDDYLKRCVPIVTPFKKIKLYTIAPIDIILSKIGRSSARDLEDIQTVVEKFGVKKGEIQRRAKKVAYVGNEKFFQANLHHLLTRIL